jgi:hypothetical protein
MFEYYIYIRKKLISFIEPIQVTGSSIYAGTERGRERERERELI